jgi:RTX calcium-binding nonapeptide repeat (4 copies)
MTVNAGAAELRRRVLLRWEPLASWIEGMVSPRLLPVVGAVVLALGAGSVDAATQANSGPVVLLGTNGPDVLAGTAADDAINGLAGDDQLAGRAGNDDLDGGPGADDLAGGAGNDAASYADAVAGVQVTLDDRANDGVAGEGDNVHSDVEDVYGGPHDDTLAGSRRDNTLDGGDGNDQLTGGGGTDGLYGGAGDDVIDAKDGGQDQVDCGPGRDRVIADRSDIVRGCELRGRPPRSGSVVIPVSNYFGVPSGVSVTAACRVGIRLELRLRGGVLAKAKVPLKAVQRRCEFRKTFRVVKRRVGSATKVKCVARYPGIRGLGGRRFAFPVKIRS